MLRLPPRLLLRLAAYQLAFSLLGLAAWVRANFGDVTVDQALWHLFYAEGSAHLVTEVFYVDCTVHILVAPLLAALVAALVHTWLAEHLRGHGRRLLHAAPALCAAGAVGVLGLQFSVYSYARAYLEPDQFASEFVDAAKVPMAAGHRRNLVLIYAESLESTYGERELFGRDLLAPLHALGGRSYPHYRRAAGATWTIAGMVATQCGVPLKVYAQQDVRVRGARSFLPRATCLGDVLHDHGYRNVFLGGVSLWFAGKGRFLRDHGYDETWGLDEWKKAGVRREETNFWGLWDDALFERAAQTLDRLHASRQPFNLTLLTLETHNPFGTMPDGFLSPACKSEGETDFEGIVSCSARRIAGFIRHARERGYLEDTAFVVIGDHPAMTNPVYDQLQAAGDRRGIFNLFVGEGLPAPNRDEIVPFDLFPTLVELVGIEVAGGRLGLGYSAVGDDDAAPPPGRADEWSTAVVNGSGRYDELWRTREDAEGAP